MTLQTSLFYLITFHATLRNYDQNIKWNENVITNRYVGTGGYNHPYPLIEFIAFNLCSFFLFIVFLLPPYVSWRHGFIYLPNMKKMKQKSFPLCTVFKLQRFSHSSLPCTLTLLNPSSTIATLWCFPSPSPHPLLSFLPVATDTVIFHLTDQPYSLAISSDSTILPSQPTYVLTLLTLAGLLSRNI